MIDINLFVKGKSDKDHWKDTPVQNVRHYKFQEQLHTDTQGLPQRYIDDMELVQYFIMNKPDNTLPDSTKQDWITFFKIGSRDRRPSFQVRDGLQSGMCTGVIHSFCLP